MTDTQTEVGKEVELDVNQQRVNTLATEIVKIIGEGVKVEKAQAGVYNLLLDIARKCANRVEFTKASDIAEREWKRARERRKESTTLPKAFVQARSNIKRFYDYQLPFVEKTKLESGAVVERPLNYNQVDKAYRLEKEKRKKMHDAEANAAEAEALKKQPGKTAFIGMYNAIMSAKGMTDQALNQFALNMRRDFEAWREENPIQEEPQEQAEDLQAAIAG